MQAWILEIMNTFGYLGIALLIMIENIFPPIPSEVILTFGGFLTTYTHLTVFGVVLTSTIGSVAGAIILYYVGRLLSKERLEKLVAGKVGKILRFKQEDIDKAMNRFERSGNSTVLVCRCVPIVRSLISIPAGMTKMPMGRFLLLTTIGSSVWNMILVNLGAFFGASWEKILFYMDHYSNIVLIVLMICAVSAFVYSKMKD
ncbi:MAG TPA: DedA family protein [Candidatus Merdenecus merdavium]|nr:DedA family protein [Candidatus Merdenecus merdavium]